MQSQGDFLPSKIYLPIKFSGPTEGIGVCFGHDVSRVCVNQGYGATNVAKEKNTDNAEWEN